MTVTEALRAAARLLDRGADNLVSSGLYDRAEENAVCRAGALPILAEVAPC